MELYTHTSQFPSRPNRLFTLKFLPLNTLSIIPGLLPYVPRDEEGNGTPFTNYITIKNFLGTNSTAYRAPTQSRRKAFYHRFYGDFLLLYGRGDLSL